MNAPEDFWTRRKAAVRAEEAAAHHAEAERAGEAERAERAQKDDVEILAELNLPDPDRLAPGDDVAAFMARAVPDRLRRRALRRLWRLNPVLANIDGLVDYGEDFSDASTAVEHLQTAYQVGRGLLAHVEGTRAHAASPATSEEPGADAPDDIEANPGAHDPQPRIPSEIQIEQPPNSASAGTDGFWASAPELSMQSRDPAPARRRMRFVFEE